MTPMAPAELTAEALKLDSTLATAKASSGFTFQRTASSTMIRLISKLDRLERA